MAAVNSYKHYLKIIDQFTQWPEVIPLKDITTQSSANVESGKLELWTLKAVIMACDNLCWSQILPFVLLVLHTAGHEEFAFSLADLVYGEKLRFPSDLVVDK